MTYQVDRWRSLAHRLAISVGFVVFAPVTAAHAQDQGGLVLTFGIDQRLEWEDNPGLDTTPVGEEYFSRTRLSFGLLSETRTQRLEFSAEGTLAASNSANTGLILPKAELSYRVEATASTALEFTTFLTETDVTSSEFTTDLSSGVPIVTLIEGTGTQRRTGGTAKIEFGREASIGGDLSVGLTDTDYTGTTDPSLIDNRRTTARLNLRFDLSEATTATAGLSTSRLEEVGTAGTQSETLSLGVKQTVSNGSYRLDATFAQLDTGNRRSLSLGRDLDLPAGILSASLGVSELAASNTIKAIGSLNWQQDLPRGKFSFALSHAVAGDARDNETEATRLTLGLTQDLSPRLGVNVAIGLADSRDTITDVSTKSANLDASLRYELTEDWGMNVGASHRIRDEDSVGRAKSTKVFLTLNRTFEFRP